MRAKGKVELDPSPLLRVALGNPASAWFVRSKFLMTFF